MNVPLISAPHSQRVKALNSKNSEASRIVGAATLNGNNDASLEKRPAILTGEQRALTDEVIKTLDIAKKKIESEGHKEFVRGLTEALRELKNKVTQEDWLTVAIPAARTHSVMALVQECALTRHSFERPRGYPGDAQLLDIIYRHPEAEPSIQQMSMAGRAVFNFTLEVSACESVRVRRRILAEKIDSISAERTNANILAIACGHLREAELSESVKGKKFGRFLATDQDAESLSVVKNFAAAKGIDIETANLSVRDFIGNKHGVRDFDFIYAAGLYDYLDARISSRLTRKLLALLNPGGKLLVANFLSGIWELPYMEAYMDWHLIYRDEQDIRNFASEISAVDVSSCDYFEDDARCIGYLELTKSH